MIICEHFGFNIYLSSGVYSCWALSSIFLAYVFGRRLAKETFLPDDKQSLEFHGKEQSTKNDYIGNV